MEKKNLLNKIRDSHVFWGILSLLMALLIWIYVASQDTEDYKVTFRVRVEIVGEDILRNSRNMVITDVDTNNVTVEVIGPRRIVGGLSADDLVAQVDVSKFTQAAYTSQTYSVIFPDGTDTSSLQTSNRTPETVSFMVSALSKKSIPVRGSFEGNIAAGFTAEQPIYDPALIMVYGPEVYLKNVKYAWLTFGADEEVDQTYSAECGYTLMNDNDEECSTANLSFSDETVLATLPIMRVKEIPLDVNLIYGAGSDETNTTITIEPKSIILSGDSAELERLNRIVLATIDTTDFNVSYSDTYPIRYEDGLDNLSGFTDAKVTVELHNLVSDKYIIRNISCSNVTEGYEAEIITDAITVTLRGTEEQMQQLRAENVSAVIDLQDAMNTTGSFTTTPKIYVDGFTEVGVIGDVPAVTYELRKAEE